MKDILAFWIWGWNFCFSLLFLLNLCISASPVSQDKQLWEGSECELEDGKIGECVKTVNCTKKLEEIQQGKYTGAGRCGFSGFDEIVCCEKKVSGKIKVDGVRPAITACQTYKDWWPTRSVPAVSGGAEAQPDEFPQIVALGYPANPDDELVIDGMKYICGGTLISEQHVLTAAHCVSNIQGLVPTEVAIMADTTDLIELKEKPGKRVPILKIVKHPNYRRSFNYHDIAVIQLKKPVSFAYILRPTCLRTKPLPSSAEGQNISLTVLGWGATDLDGTRSSKLLIAENLKPFETSECSVSYRNLEAQIPTGLDEGMICVVDPDTQRKADTCSGDSGGPLFLGWDLFPELVGVTSFGQACGVGTPGIYSSVYKYLDWIESVVWPVYVPEVFGCWILQCNLGLLNYLLNEPDTISYSHQDLSNCIKHLL